MLRPCRRPLCLLVGGNYWGLVICSLGGAFAVFVMVFEGARRSFLSSKWSVWRAGGILAGKLGTEVDYGSIWKPPWLHFNSIFGQGGANLWQRPSFLLGLCHVSMLLAVLAPSWRHRGSIWEGLGLDFGRFGAQFGGCSLEFD